MLNQPVSVSTAIVPYAPDPKLHEWVIVKLLPKFGWQKVEVAAVVLAHSADGSRVMIGYFSPSCWKRTTKWIDRTSIVRILQPAADETAEAVTPA